MKKRQPAEDPQPKAVTMYTAKLDDAQMEQLRGICDTKMWEPFEVDHARFAFRGPKLNVVAYRSGKLVLQGKETQDFIINVLEPEVLKTATFGYEEVIHPERYELHAGLDESGKGDFFGPIITACVIADKPQIERWIQAGIRDSKTIGEAQILKLDELIRHTPGAVAKSAWCGMAKYNELMSRPKANLNRLLAWLHAKSLQAALQEKRAPWGLLDQFSKQNLVGLYFKDPEFDLRMRTKAEEDPVVAAASVVARAEFVRQMHKLSQQFGEKLQKGASSLVKDQAHRIIERHGVGALRDVAKLHFRTAYEVVSAAGKLGELPLPPPKAAFRR
jgi:ribonuclease HIII